MLQFVKNLHGKVYLIDTSIDIKPGGLYIDESDHLFIGIEKPDKLDGVEGSDMKIISFTAHMLLNKEINEKMSLTEFVYACNKFDLMIDEIATRLLPASVVRQMHDEQ